MATFFRAWKGYIYQNEPGDSGSDEKLGAVGVRSSIGHACVGRIS